MGTLFDAIPTEATLFADGGSRGNPGPAASGAVLLDANGQRIVHKPFAGFGAPLAAAAVGNRFASVSLNGRLHLWTAEGIEAVVPASVWDAGSTKRLITCSRRL